jgi:hypothetical protein
MYNILMYNILMYKILMYNILMYNILFNIISCIISCFTQAMRLSEGMMDSLSAPTPIAASNPLPPQRTQNQVESTQMQLQSNESPQVLSSTPHHRFCAGGLSTSMSSASEIAILSSTPPTPPTSISLGTGAASSAANALGTQLIGVEQNVCQASQITPSHPKYLAYSGSRRSRERALVCGRRRRGKLYF